MPNLTQLNALKAALGLGVVINLPVYAADSVTEAVAQGKASVNVRLRYEAVEDDNAATKDAEVATLRTRLGYSTGEFQGFSGHISFEDVRHVLGIEDYSLGVTGFKSGEFSTIADPEVTELDTGYLQYTQDTFKARVGAQVIALDNHRFIGHVGWRQDRQTFDAVMLQQTLQDNISLSYYYIDQRRRIFAEAADQDSKDHLFHIKAPVGPGDLVAYAYLLELDNGTNNALDTYGVRYKGKMDGAEMTYLYTAEFATQTNELGTTENDADYLFLEGGVKVADYTFKAGYESLGSDKGNYGFSTPLSTLHKFNGWADLFLATPAQGLTDFYLSAGTKLGSGNATVIYHTFEADDATATVDDLGSEINLLYTHKFNKHYSAGAKYAAYSADATSGGRVDTDRIWFWVSANI